MTDGNRPRSDPLTTHCPRVRDAQAPSGEERLPAIGSLGLSFVPTRSRASVKFVEGAVRSLGWRWSRRCG